MKFTDVAGIMNIPYVAEKVKLSHVAEIVKLSHVAEILEAGSMYDQKFNCISFLCYQVCCCQVLTLSTTRTGKFLNHILHNKEPNKSINC